MIDHRVAARTGKTERALQIGLYLFGQGFAQHRSGPQEARLDHVTAYAKAISRFLYAHVFDGPQDENAAVDRRQVFDRSLQEIAHLTAFGHGFR
ncbi:hypothetical protein D3C72_2215830 [compost metagenome]